MICSICPRKCEVNRETQLGFCRSPWNFRVARAALHQWEEPCISGKNGSGTVFFSGCNLQCVFCQNYEISLENKGVEITDSDLINIFENLISQGAHNINLVNPSHYAAGLKRVLTKWKSPVPIVYNSSGYESVETLKMLDGLIDIYLPDFKYIRQDKAKRYSNAYDYPDVAKAAIGDMLRQQSICEFENGMMTKGVIIRHLILPQNTNSSIEILDYIKNNFSGAYISLMAQYTPCTNLEEFPEINRKITKREYEKVLNYALDSGFQNVFVQELDSASQGFIPAFDFTGVL